MLASWVRVRGSVLRAWRPVGNWINVEQYQLPPLRQRRLLLFLLLLFSYADCFLGRSTSRSRSRSPARLPARDRSRTPLQPSSPQSFPATAVTPVVLLSLDEYRAMTSRISHLELCQGTTDTDLASLRALVVSLQSEILNLQNAARVPNAPPAPSSPPSRATLSEMAAAAVRLGDEQPSASPSPTDSDILDLSGWMQESGSIASARLTLDIQPWGSKLIRRCYWWQRKAQRCTALAYKAYSRISPRS